MIIQQTQFVTHKESAAMAYATPQLSRFGNVSDVTCASGTPAVKLGQAMESSQGNTAQKKN